MKSSEKDTFSKRLHNFFMLFTDWLTTPPSRNHMPPFIWIVIVTSFPLAIALPIAKAHSGWVKWITGFIGFGAAFVFFAVIILAVISRVYKLHFLKRRNKNIEIYVKSCSYEVIINWLTELFGPLNKVEDEFHIYHAESDGQIVAITLQDHIEGGPFTGVFINPRPPKWSTSVEFAKEASKQLNCQVRCEPGIAHLDVDPCSDYFLQIEGVKEVVIWWSDTLIEEEKLENAKNQN